MGDFDFTNSDELLRSIDQEINIIKTEHADPDIILYDGVAQIIKEDDEEKGVIVQFAYNHPKMDFRTIQKLKTTRDAYERFAIKAIKALKQGSSIIVFPEGTRSSDGKLGKFKDGAFRLAHEARVPILPMLLDGTAAAVPKKGWVIMGRGMISLKVLDPIPYESFESLTMKETSEMVRGVIEGELERSV